MGAPACASGTPAINVVYPIDGVLVPPNMDVISVQWTPFGAPFTEFEVDFENAHTDMRVTATCSMQTMDTEQTPQASGGCELVLTPAMWTAVANENRGGDPVKITVRGTTDGMCASASAAVNMEFAADDLNGAIYYWKSTVTANVGTGGQIWEKTFGDLTPEQDITTPLNLGTCNGCHALSRDGLRMVINSDDNDSDDEYTDVTPNLVDYTAGLSAGMVVNMTATAGGVPAPGFATFFPDHTQFLISNGPGTLTPPTNVLFLYDGTTGMQKSTVTNLGTATQMATMPDWSADGKSVIFVIPQKAGTWTGTFGDMDNNDDHVFGGSLYTMSYSGGTFGAPTPFLMSAGENNYYPGYSPDGQLIVFDRVTLQGSGAVDTCTMTPHPGCPNDSFSNPNARLTLMQNMAGTMPIDLANANGSPAASPQALSNSWPKWSPFLNDYKGHKLLWIAFSSTRDYGVRVRNHQPNMYQCYPPDSLELPGADHGSVFDPLCQQPQLWMAAIDVTVAQQPQRVVKPDVAMDPSFKAFWLPYQDITTHNHTPQWTQSAASKPPPDAGACIPENGSGCNTGGTCCASLICTAAGTCEPLPQ
jgi:hypothetical protein